MNTYLRVVTLRGDRRSGLIARSFLLSFSSFLKYSTIMMPYYHNSPQEGIIVDSLLNPDKLKILSDLRLILC